MKNSSFKNVLFLLLAFCLLAIQPAQAASQKKSNVQNSPTGQSVKYSGNVKTLKFHNEGCKFFDCRDCTRFFSSREAAQKAGYKACGKCGG